MCLLHLKRGVIMPVKCWNGKRARIKKRQMMDKQNGICPYCYREMSYEEATFDHIIPTSEGGPDTVDNIVLCCDSCNNERGNKDINKFLTQCLGWASGFNYLPFIQSLCVRYDSGVVQWTR